MPNRNEPIGNVTRSFARLCARSLTRGSGTGPGDSLPRRSTPAGEERFDGQHRHRGRHQLSGPEPAGRRTSRAPAGADDGPGKGRAVLPLHDQHRPGRRARRRQPGVQHPLPRRPGGRAPHQPLQSARPAGRSGRGRALAQQAPGAGRLHPARYSGQLVHRSAALVHRQPGRRVQRRGVLGVAGDHGARRDRRRGTGRDVRRHRPSGVRRGRPALRPAPADRPGDRATLGAAVRHFRRGRGADRRSSVRRTSGASRACGWTEASGRARCRR